MGKNKHVAHDKQLRRQRAQSQAVLEERFKCANLAQEFRDRALRDGMITAAQAGEEIAELIRNQR